MRRPIGSRDQEIERSIGFSMAGDGGSASPVVLGPDPRSTRIVAPNFGWVRESDGGSGRRKPVRETGTTFALKLRAGRDQQATPGDRTAHSAPHPQQRSPRLRGPMGNRLRTAPRDTEARRTDASTAVDLWSMREGGSRRWSRPTAPGRTGGGPDSGPMSPADLAATESTRPRRCRSGMSSQVRELSNKRGDRRGFR